MPAYVDYRELVIKEFDSWSLQLHKYQHPYIGRCCAWCRGKARSIVEMTEKEHDELFFHVIPKWFDAVKELYKAEVFDASCHGNETHLRWHLVPKFSGKKVFYGIEFEADQQSKNYERKDISLDILRKIRNDISSKIK